MRSLEAVGCWHWFSNSDIRAKSLFSELFFIHFTSRVQDSCCSSGNMPLEESRKGKGRKATSVPFCQDNKCFLRSPAEFHLSFPAAKTYTIQWVGLNMGIYSLTVSEAGRLTSSQGQYLWAAIFGVPWLFHHTAVHMAWTSSFWSSPWLFSFLSSFICFSGSVLDQG